MILLAGIKLSKLIIRYFFKTEILSATEEYFYFRYLYTMAAKFVDKPKCVLRFSDFPTQPKRMLPPIQGYENMPLVTLEEAVESLTSLVPDVDRMVWTVKQNQFDREHGLTDDELASILLYTMEWDPRDKSFYIILNSTLQAANRDLLKPWFLYLRLIMTALDRLPSDPHLLIVHRGVKLDLSAQYPKGSMITWWGFSSCTTSLEVLDDDRFLGRSGTRTLFNIECQSAKSIKSFSFYPEEEEVLLPPGRQFQVMSCLDPGNGLHIIQMKEIQPKFPLINPVPKSPTLPSNPIPSKPPNCGNPKLQKYIDVLYLGPVNIRYQLTFSANQDYSSLATLCFKIGKEQIILSC